MVVSNNIFSLSCTLEGLTKQNSPPESFEVLVINNGSSEPIESLVEAYVEALNVRCIRLEKSSILKCKNKALTFIKEGLVIFYNSHHYPHPDFVKMHCQKYKQNRNRITISQLLMRNGPVIKKDKVKTLNMINASIVGNYPSFQFVNYIFDREGESITSFPWIAMAYTDIAVPLDVIQYLGNLDTNFKAEHYGLFELGYRAYLESIPIEYERNAKSVVMIDGYKDHPHPVPQDKIYFYKISPSKSIYKINELLKSKISLREYAEYVDPQKSHLSRLSNIYIHKNGHPPHLMQSKSKFKPR